MPTLGIESNGRLERTAVYFNGEQIAGLKELMLNLDENGTFDAVMQYEGVDKQLYTKNVFLDSLINIRIVEPSFTDEDARNLSLLEIQSDGDIDSTIVARDGEMSGLVSVFLHLRSANAPKGGLSSIFGTRKNTITEGAVFSGEFVFRNDDDSLSTENIF
jgi:hypothetical protein